jgi:hypothetical protein
MVAGGLKHWKSGEALQIQDGKVVVKVAGKTIDIYCRKG